MPLHRFLFSLIYIEVTREDYWNQNVQPKRVFMDPPVSFCWEEVSYRGVLIFAMAAVVKTQQPYGGGRHFGHDVAHLLLRYPPVG